MKLFNKLQTGINNISLRFIVSLLNSIFSIVSFAATTEPFPRRSERVKKNPPSDFVDLDQHREGLERYIQGKRIVSLPIPRHKFLPTPLDSLSEKSVGLLEPEIPVLNKTLSTESLESVQSDTFHTPQHKINQPISISELSLGKFHSKDFVKPDLKKLLPRYKSLENLVPTSAVRKLFQPRVIFPFGEITHSIRDLTDNSLYSDNRPTPIGSERRILKANTDLLQDLDHTFEPFSSSSEESHSGSIPIFESKSNSDSESSDELPLKMAKRKSYDGRFNEIDDADLVNRDGQILFGDRGDLCRIEVDPKTHLAIKVPIDIPQFYQRQYHLQQGPSVSPIPFSAKPSENSKTWMQRYSMIAGAKNWNEEQMKKHLPLYLLD